MEACAIVSGFEPFGSHSRNVSAEIAERLDNRKVGGIRVRARVLPVAFGQDVPPLLEAIEQFAPKVIIMLGLSSGAACVEVERFAVNLRSTDTPGDQVPILPTAPLAYASTLPLRIVVQAVRRTGVPARAHAYAGAYLCNHIMFQALHHLSESGLHVPCGFLHLPHAAEELLDESGRSVPSLPIRTLEAAVAAAVAACAGGPD